MTARTCAKDKSEPNIKDFEEINWHSKAYGMKQRKCETNRKLFGPETSHSKRGEDELEIPINYWFCLNTLNKWSRIPNIQHLFNHSPHILLSSWDSDL